MMNQIIYKIFFTCAIMLALAAPRTHAAPNKYLLTLGIGGGATLAAAAYDWMHNPQADKNFAKYCAQKSKRFYRDLITKKSTTSTDETKTIVPSERAFKIAFAALQLGLACCLGKDAWALRNATPQPEITRGLTPPGLHIAPAEPKALQQNPLTAAKSVVPRPIQQPQPPASNFPSARPNNLTLRTQRQTRRPRIARVVTPIQPLKQLSPDADFFEADCKEQLILILAKQNHATLSEDDKEQLRRRCFDWMDKSGNTNSIISNLIRFLSSAETNRATIRKAIETYE